MASIDNSFARHGGTDEHVIDEELFWNVVTLFYSLSKANKIIKKSSSVIYWEVKVDNKKGGDLA